jgi:hypothetical protein
MENGIPYEILAGTGLLYAAPVGTTFPLLTAVPAATWVLLGDTDGGVTVTLDQTVEVKRSDQRTGPVKAFRTEEDLRVKTSLLHATLENLQLLHTNSLTDTPAGAGTIGTREINLHRGFVVDEYALLFRGVSAYGNYPAQYEVPRGFIDSPIELVHAKDDTVAIPMEFRALEDPNAATEAERFGKLIMQDAAAL